MAADRILKLAAIGTAAGAFSGLFGVGGGTVIVPLLILWFGFGERLATGTSLLAIIVIAILAAALQGALRQRRPARGALLVGVPALGGVVVGTALQQRLPERTISLMFAAAADRHRGGAGDRLMDASPWRSSPPLALGFAGGMVGGLIGVGGGVLFVPALALFLDQSQLEAESTSLLAIVFVAVVGAWRQHGYGNVAPSRRAPGGGCCRSLGVVAGVLLANEVSERALELAFAALVVFIAIRLVLRAPRTPTPKAAGDG